MAKTIAETEKEWAWEHTAEAYKERDLLVCALARRYPSHLMEHSQSSAARRRVVVCIHTHEGHLNFMLTDDMLTQLADLEMQESHWDGSKRPEKRARMYRLGLKHEQTPV